MSVRGAVAVADRHRFDAVIDARSPAEFHLDHIPGAINCPVLDDEERRIVGTIYHQQGAFEARRTGGAMVAANLDRHLRTVFAEKPADWKPLVYCWRGGLRSSSMVTWMRLVGWDAQQLSGGYKRWRRHVIDTIDRIAPALPLVVICGATGSAKTRVLHELARRGAAVIDLEDLAAHKGSMLGAVPGREQPSQKAFETALAEVLERVADSGTAAGPVFVEAESRRIGRLSLPTALLERMRASPCCEIGAPPAARIAYLLRDYAYLGDDPEGLAARLAPLVELHGNEALRRWQAQARERRLGELYAELVERHYDPLYARSQCAHFGRWEAREILRVERLEDMDIEDLAARVRASAWPPTPGPVPALRGAATGGVEEGRDRVRAGAGSGANRAKSRSSAT